MSKNTKPFSVRARIRSFSFAIQGIKTLFREEDNAKVHVLTAVIVIIGGFYFDISHVEWMLIAIAIGFVLVTEIVNTALENICDYLTEETDPLIKRIKDLSAGAVLISALTAIVIGLIVFIPRIYALFQYI
ncbi:diacylglycerol kinase family protein [Salibacter sp.]|uniref:diacylglycerol kinase family protein n=1 Tax=Salibacter sp. TaxID=2010995 RepID=UPI002870530F|nr:diacylglycerol kinase family protein [Salibacter sp.]MDR9399232.1 diacylglycerol kinase family protein [Salibacter sp.]MDR9488221.1 diacylglycerol kinase family protein [Salibacter sp.]